MAMKGLGSLVAVMLLLSGQALAVPGDPNASPGVRTLDRAWDPAADAWFPYRNAARIRGHLEQLRQQRELLADRFKDPHPALRRLDYEIGVLRHQLGWLAACEDHAAACIGEDR